MYRLACQVYVMGVAPAHGNVFFAARVVDAATHHLVAVNRGISVTPDRIANRFPEVGPATHDAPRGTVGRSQSIYSHGSAGVWSPQMARSSPDAM